VWRRNTFGRERRCRNERHGRNDAHTTTTFDSDGIMVSVDYGQGTTATYNTTSRATVCR
jgi:hypothetical protein